MIAVGSLEDEITLLKESCEWGSFEYYNSSGSFRTCATLHFRGVERQDKHGIYVIRQRNTREVLYIGKSGTIDSKGQFKGQDIPGRLKNVKGPIRSNKWFLDLLNEKGPLIIEYIFLSPSKSPAFVEAALLQAYLNEHHRLPFKNKSL